MNSILNRILFFSVIVSVISGSKFDHKDFCDRNPKITSYLKLSENDTIYTFNNLKPPPPGPPYGYIFSSTIQPNGKIHLYPDLRENSPEAYLIENYYIRFCPYFDSVISSAAVNNEIQIGCILYMPNNDPDTLVYYFQSYVLNQSSFQYINYSTSNHTTGFDDFPFLKVYEKLKSVPPYDVRPFIINELVYIEFGNKTFLLVFREESNQSQVNLYDLDGNGIDKKQMPKPPSALFIDHIKEDIKSGVVVKNISLYMSFQQLFASYELIIKEETNANTITIESLERKSIFKENKLWFGCLTQICFDANIDDMTYDNIDSDIIFIFSGLYYWRWNPFERVFYPHNDFVELLHTEYRNIDSAFTDPSPDVNVIIGGNVKSFSSHSNKTRNVSEMFPDFRDKVNAITFDFKANEMHLFSSDMFWIYSRKADNSYIFKTKTKLSELNLPNNLNAAFTDDNGDNIYIKGNHFFWKEYGVMRTHRIQELFFCSKFDYQTFKEQEIQNWNQYLSDVKTYDKLDFSEQTIPKPTPIPERVDEITTKTTTTTESIETTSVNISFSSSTKPTDDELVLEKWQIFILVCFGIFVLIVVVVLFYFCGIYFGRKSEESSESKRRKLRERLRSKSVKSTKH